MGPGGLGFRTPRIGEVLPFTMNGRISYPGGSGFRTPRIGEVLPFTMNGRKSLSWGFGVPNPQDRRSPPVHDERQDHLYPGGSGFRTPRIGEILPFTMNGRITFILGVRGPEPPGSGVRDERGDHP